MIYGYIRVSTEKQTVQNQQFELTRFAKNKNISIDHFVEETISGMASLQSRKLGILVKNLKKGDILIISELSRLGRSLLQIMGLLNICMEKGVIIYSIKENYELGDNINSKVLAFAFSLSAEIERQLISQRTKEALARKKAEGIILGRPKGSKSRLECNPCYHAKDKILAWDCKGESHTKIARRLGVHRDTLRRWFIISGNDHLLKGKNYRNSKID
ncbi:master DNA invertase Mpi family serine-type recombinase [Helicobacter sp. 11S03491-1]|uniref:master DNA invertase Mpi family serine-type recombinase n=1 Tax=Helicobacter sp. 11S03491-1 TaxID=1476196 RepID=UPI000BA62F10|nr:master DNA invertase Mpi family serine-type recombinase [Helicobacter sp. 11S03491-1]PAF41447.1 invertase [Helicobacter sp. 11S03491-1]